MASDRMSGILLHPTSLPGRYGIGEIGREARNFAEILRAMGQRVWQVLPIGPTSYGDSPYQCLSTFAGNPLLIGFDDLVEDGLLAPSRVARFPRFDPGRVDFGAVIPARQAVLDSVCRSFARRAPREVKTRFETFCEQSERWLEDYALYVALKDAHGGQPWTRWEGDLAAREPEALRRAARRLRTPIRNERIRQFLFFDQWQRLLTHCRALGLRIMGDLPIFVAHDSADVWAHRDLFHLDRRGQPSVVAGVPPDYFSETGQRWGNPLYDWARHAETGYAWWIDRMRVTLELFDLVRVDHFRGFEAYWEIPAREKTAVKGRWVKGPGEPFFEALQEALGGLPIVAEDLGVITPEVEALRDRFGFPGMRVLQFIFGPDGVREQDRPENYPENCVCYTGTHDNDTTRGWYEGGTDGDSTRSREAIERERDVVRRFLGKDGSEIHWDLIEVALKCPANLAVAPLQDVLGLGSEARMNVPGRPQGNWQWRVRREQITPDLVDRMKALVRATNRGGRATAKRQAANRVH